MRIVYIITAQADACNYKAKISTSVLTCISVVGGDTSVYIIRLTRPLRRDLGIRIISPSSGTGRVKPENV